MSKKVVRTIGKAAGIVAVVALAATGIGIAAGGAGMALIIGGTAVSAATITTIAGAVAAGAGMLAGKKLPHPEQVDALAPRLVTNGTVLRGGLDWPAMRDQTPAAMPPIRSRWHFGRWSGARPVGGCLANLRPAEANFMLIDRRAEIRPGDIVSFKIKGERQAMLKRFVNATADAFEFETTNPVVEKYVVRRALIAHAYRVRRYVADANDFDPAIKKIETDETLHNERLGRVRYPEGYRFAA